MPSYKINALFYHQCEKMEDQVEGAVRAALAEIGIFDSNVVTFEVGSYDGG